ncbi:Hpt domain-containing protein [Leptobacterium sp. I13]|uniref:Hpt domain-containing protein n=1 Tax=Leptobacterium meishanense TaxID=3128904 RepID=UPI0030EF70FB
MHYNLDKVNELSGGDEEFTISIISVFLEETPQDILDLKEAIEKEDFQAIYKSAHKIKPNADIMGMEGARAKLLEIENQGKQDKDIEVIKSLFPSVEASINSAITELKNDFGL